METAATPGRKAAATGAPGAGTPASGCAGTGEGTARLAREASIESSARNLAEVDRYAEWLAPGTEVYIPWLPGAPFHHSMSLAIRLRQAGFDPVPHLAAKRLDSLPSAAAFLVRLRSEAAVDKVLLVGGDADRAAGPFPDALSVLESGLLEAHGIRRVGLAAYPEGHPKVGPAALEQALARKLERVHAAGMEALVVTQFCFDAGAVIACLRALRAAGHAVPVRVGVAGPASIRSLLTYAARCGIGPSVRAVWGGPVSLRDLLSIHGPDAVVTALADALQGGAVSGPVGLHLFSFGGVRASARWLLERAGSAAAH